MSEENSIDDVQLDIIGTLSKHQDVILDNKDLIESAFKQNTYESELLMDSSDIAFGVMMALSASTEDDDSLEIAYALLNFISTSDVDYIRKLRQENVKQELVDFVTNLSLNYQLEVGRVASIETQGANFWSSISSDLVIRSPNDVAGFNHKITIAHDREVEIDTSIGSNLGLVRYLIGQQIRAMETLEDQALDQISIETLDEIVKRVEHIREQVEASDPQTNSGRTQQ